MCPLILPQIAFSSTTLFSRCVLNARLFYLEYKHLLIPILEFRCYAILNQKGSLIVLSTSIIVLNFI